MNGLFHWSFSSLSLYHSCPYAVKLKYIEHLPEPPPDPKREAANERGTRLHAVAEDIVLRGAPVPKEFDDFKDNFAQLRALYLDPTALVEVEKRTYFDSNWRLSDKDDYWLVVVRDAFVVSPEFALTIDYKTGKRFGNEVKHFGQTSLYAVAAWIEYPMFDEYPAELWYMDQNHIQEHTYSIRSLERARAQFDKGVELMFSDKYFRPHPSVPTCKYCPYSPRGTGACAVGV